MIVAVTGHRPDKLIDGQVTKRVYDYLVDRLREFKPEKCISGMATGVDQVFAAACVDLCIPFIAAVPFSGQEDRWNANSKSLYSLLMRNAAEIKVISDTYTAWAYQKRNEWMVDNCDILLGVWDGSSGGTANCLKYAGKVGRKFFIVNPKELKDVR